MPPRGRPRRGVAAKVTEDAPAVTSYPIRHVIVIVFVLVGGGSSPSSALSRGYLKWCAARQREREPNQSKH
ncbi:hypothetical protein GGR58DRAFT_499825 [Xylaria digitata]|nr:hypothetical protein GGR58DRAFT_499825 [Xylaria digitata]